MAYVHGATRKPARQLAVTLRNAQIQRAHLAKKLEGVTNEIEALRRARDIINQAHRDARVIREQAYDFGLAQLDRDYATRQDRNRERQMAKNKLVKKYAKERLLAATRESEEWDARQRENAA